MAFTPEDDLPWKQLFVLALCRICEPIAFMSIFPYSYRMIETFELTSDKAQISTYAGMLITAFALAEFSTGVIWGHISDKVGRKPVLTIGLIGTALSMICFGFSKNFSSAIIARALGGLLNGNIGVLQTIVAELITKKEQQPRAYSIMPFVWCLGSIIGPALGGALAVPCEAYPWLFAKGTVYDRYPFLLPNLVCVLILVLGIAVSVLFLEETHLERRYKLDWGLYPGRCLASRSAKTDNFNVESSPLISTAVADDDRVFSKKQDKDVARTFDRQVILVIVGYGILAYHSVSFDTLMPIFLSEAPMTGAAKPPFRFSGGFGLSTKTVGIMMAVQGTYSIVAQLWMFPFILRHFSTLTAFRAVMLVWPLLCLAVPYLVLLPVKLQTSGIYFCLLLKITFHVIAFPANAILLANAAPSKSVLGSVNGVAASTASLTRALGPTVTGSVHSVGLHLGYGGLAWWTIGLVCAFGALESFWICEAE